MQEFKYKNKFSKLSLTRFLYIKIIYFIYLILQTIIYTVINPQYKFYIKTESIKTFKDLLILEFHSPMLYKLKFDS